MEQLFPPPSPHANWVCVCDGVVGWGTTTVFTSISPSICMKYSWFPLKISMNLRWYLTTNKIQVQLEKGGYASILAGVVAPDRSEKNWKIFGFHSITFNNLTLNDWIYLKSIWYISNNKIQVQVIHHFWQELWPPDKMERIWFLLSLSLNERISNQFI